MENNNFITIRTATIDDWKSIYDIGLKTPEIKVSVTEEFMEPAELQWSITNPWGIFLVAKEGGEIIGFSYATYNDPERPFPFKFACLVYLVVLPEFRRQGIAGQLYAASEKYMKDIGIEYIYVLANIEGNGEIVSFMKQQGFAEGHRYVWMDKLMQKREEIIVKQDGITAAIHVHKQIPEFDTSWDVSAFKKRYAGKKPLVLVAYIGEIPVGYMVSYNRDGDGSFYCWMTGVIPAFRKQGALNTMMEYVEEWAKKQGYISLKIKTRNIRREMLAFLVDRNFKFTRVSRKNLSVNDYRIHLQKWLG